MKFTIKCETFCRMASIVSFFQPSTPLEIRKQLECIRLENHKGNVFAIATNQKFAAVEFLGTTTEPDGVAHVVYDPVLVAQCEKEKAYDSFLTITTIPEIASAFAVTMMGFNYNGNACLWPGKTIMDEWRTWGPDKPATKSKGALFMNLDYVVSLFSASPSGKIIFPEFIDKDIPVVVRDRINPNWVGLIMGKPPVTETDAKPATLPTWWVK